MANLNNSFNTPPELLKPIKEFFVKQIDLDPCSNDNSLVEARTNLKLPTDSLKEDWSYYVPVGGSIFINPPFNPYYLSTDGIVLSPKEYKKTATKENKFFWRRVTIKDWVNKAFKVRDRIGAQSICLVPARGMGNSLWQKIVLPNFNAICFLSKRYPFWENGEPCKGPDGKINPPNFDCALVYFGTHSASFKEKFNKHGFVIESQ